MTSRKIAIISLGCPKNLVDSEELMGMIGASGGVVCDRPEDADVLIINTCGFIEEAKQESIDFILDAIKIKQQKKSYRIIVTGCLAERYPAELKKEMPEIAEVIGLHRSKDVLAACGLRGRTDMGGRLRLTPRHYAYLRISEGCDNCCSYCAIPSIRGPLKSFPMERLIEEARELAADGAVELNLIAQDTAAYGLDTAGHSLLPMLIEKIAAIPALRWIRVLYTHPRHLSDEIIKAMAGCEKVCRYVDLPLQHNNGRILRAMGRKISSSRIKELIDRIRSGIPGVVIRTSIIVGFPGETQEEFEELLEFVRRERFERLGAFAYSREEGTPAHSYPDQIAEEIKEDRLDRLMSCQQEIAFKQNRDLIGKRIQVIVDARSEDAPEKWEGRSEGDAPEVDGMILVSGGRNLAPGKIVTVRVTGVNGYDLAGEWAGD